MIGALGTGLASAGSIGLGALNYSQQSQQNKWQKYAQEKTWDREDNAIQRRTADLKAAGLSPVLAAGSGASTMSPISINAPQANSEMASGLAKAMQGALTGAQIDQTNAATNASKTQSQMNQANTLATITTLQAKLADITASGKLKRTNTRKQYLDNQSRSIDLKNKQSSGIDDSRSGATTSINRALRLLEKKGFSLDSMLSPDRQKRDSLIDTLRKGKKSENNLFFNKKDKNWSLRSFWK